MQPQGVEDPFEWAPVYRALGWGGTLPLRLGTKWPPPNGYTGAEGAWPSDLDLEGWACRPRPQNVALRLPLDVVALDVDAMEAFTALTATLGALPPTWRSQGDPSRIGHLFYRLPADTLSAGLHDPCPGIELLRFEHRYSVVAPSRHPDGHVYQWWAPDGTRGGLPRPADLPELPLPWVLHLSSPRPQVPVERLNADKSLSGGGMIGDPIPENAHRETLFRFACSLSARGVAPDLAEPLLNLRAQDCVGPCGQGGHGWEREGLSAYGSYGVAEPRPLPLDTSEGFREPPALAEPPARPEGPVPVDWAELWTRTERTDWVVPGIVPAGRGVVLYSAPKTGKSLLALEMAAAVARGSMFLGSECARGSVVYFDRENDPVGDVRRILVAMGLGPADLDGLHYYSFPRMGQLDTKAGGQALLDIALRHEASVAVVDTTTRFVGGKEVDPETWAAYFNYTGMIFKEAGIALLRLDHEGKDAERGMRGSSSKAADPDLVWHLERTGDEFILTCDYSRLRLDVDTYAYRREDGPLRSVFLPGDRQSAGLRQDAVKLRAIWEALDAARVPEAAGRPTAQAALRAAGVRCDNNLLAAVVAVRKAQGNDFYAYPAWAPERYLVGTQGHVNTVLTPPAVLGEGFK